MLLPWGLAETEDVREDTRLFFEDLFAMRYQISRSVGGVNARCWHMDRWHRALDKIERRQRLLLTLMRMICDGVR